MTRHRLALTALLVAVGAAALAATRVPPSATPRTVVVPGDAAATRAAGVTAVRLLAALSDLSPAQPVPSRRVVAATTTAGLSSRLDAHPVGLTTAELTAGTRQRLTVTATATRLAGTGATVQIVATLTQTTPRSPAMSSGLAWTCQLTRAATGGWRVAGVS